MSKLLQIKIVNYEQNVTLESGVIISDLIQAKDKDKFIAAKVNNEVTSLSYMIEVDSNIEFLTRQTACGMQVYRRSLSFLLSKIVDRLFPNKRLIIGHSLGPGYYFDIEGLEVTEEIVDSIEKAMKAEVSNNKPIVRDKITYAECLAHFKENHKKDKYKLLNSLNTSKISIYKCDDFFQLFDGALAPSTGVLNVFQLIYYKSGFVLQFPRKSKPDLPAVFHEQSKIFAVYREYKNWGKILKVDNVGSLNHIIMNNNIKQFIQVAEALHEKKVADFAQEIFQRDHVKIIAIAGPSSSGKTTFSKKLAIQLKALALKPVTISVDNYFIDRDKTPLDRNGNPDFESIKAINIELLNEHLTALLKSKTIKPAIYDFITGQSKISEQTLSISKDEIIIIEGIHCLNEELTHTIPSDKKYKIYVSALTQMNIDDNNRIPTTDIRILRRMVRDYKYRGHSARKTLKMWPSVREGEERYIFPFQNEADGYFNSALDYELSIIKPYAQRLLAEIKPFHAEYSEALRLIKFLKYFLPIPANDVPKTSLLREFIGGSAYKY